MDVTVRFTGDGSLKTAMDFIDGGSLAMANVSGPIKYCS